MLLPISTTKKRGRTNKLTNEIITTGCGRIIELVKLNCSTVRAKKTKVDQDNSALHPTHVIA